MPDVPNDRMAFCTLAKNGRYAVYARFSQTDPWIQVESIMGLKFAREYVGDLQENDHLRQEAIEDSADDQWAEEDQGIDPPTKGEGETA